MSLLGLVADYGSDSENSASNNDDDDMTPVAQKEEVKVKAASVEGRNLLEIEDSSSEEDDPEEMPAEKKKNTINQNQRLPNPLLDQPNLDSPFKESGSVTSETLASVFTNQYREAEKAKHQILEKHVKMTENMNIQNKQVCWKFKKGKCRFGKNCKYSHDLGEISVPDKTSTNDSDTGSSIKNNNCSSGHARVMYGNNQDWFADSEQVEQDDDSYMGNMKRKRRAGINDSLLPSKKALLPLEHQRASERPWTVKSKR